MKTQYTYDPSKDKQLYNLWLKNVNMSGDWKTKKAQAKPKPLKQLIIEFPQ